MRVQRPPQIDLLTTLAATLDHLQIPSDGPALLVLHRPRLLVAHPGVGTSASGVYPHDVFEAEILPQGRVDDLDRHDHEPPALGADVRLVAARPDLVVVRQIDIEAELLHEGPEGAAVP